MLDSQTRRHLQRIIKRLDVLEAKLGIKTDETPLVEEQKADVKKEIKRSKT